MRNNRRHKSLSKWWGLLVLAALAYWAMPYLSKFKGFDAQDSVTHSELKNAEFKAEVQEIESPKHKIRAYLMVDRENPIISVNFLFKNSGYAGDNADEQGMATMTAVLLGEGAGDYSAEALKEELETRAIRIGFGADKDDFSGQLLTTKDNLDAAARFLNLILTAPHFEAKDIERVQKQMLNALLRQQESPEQQLGLAFNQELFGSHPYARNPLGRKQDILKIDAPKLQRFVKDHLVTNTLMVGIAGDISEEEAKKLIDTLFEGVAADGRVNFVREAELSFDGRSKRLDKTIGQNITLKAIKGVSRNDEDFYPLYVANYILGGAGLTSKLSLKIREEKGLTYGVYTYLVLDDKAPLIMAGFSSTPDKFAQAEEIFAATWQDFVQNGMTEQELDKAKNYLIASNNLRFASIENVSAMLLMMQKYDLGLDFLQKRNDYIGQLKLGQINRVIKKYFDAKPVEAAIGSF